ncbi:hypothetical protein [Nocardia concava]|uniref:hypothetical protein n=1 Tax=Nocardia concava TaxID=257281 RepID=UPI0002DA8B56|nr:hypothetical protein [Nocardia concava]
MNRDSDASATLRRELGPDLTALAALTESDSAELLRLFERARAGRRTALDRAIAETLRMAPRPLRGPARKILFGKQHGNG